MFGSDCKGEAVLYYLYMMADGEVSYSEEKIFDEICRKLSLDTDEKNSVIEECKDFTEKEKEIYKVILREEIDKRAGQHEMGWMMPFGGGMLKNASDLARIIWNLIKLGYADTVYSEEEKEIVNYLVDKWDISVEVYQEMIDIADTILALTKHKEWIGKAFSKGSVRDRKEKNIDIEIQKLIDDVELTINEITI